MPTIGVQSSINDDESLLKQLFGSTPTLIDELPVDILLNETPVFSWEMTNRRIDAGFDATDSRYKKPNGITLDCVFCNPDLSAGAVLSNVAETLLTGGDIAEANPFTNASALDKKASLLSLADQNKVISVVTPNTELDNMFIANIRPLYGWDKADAFFFRIELKEARMVTSETVKVDDSMLPEALKAKKDPSAEKKTSKKKPKGKKPTKKPEAKKESILNKLIGKYL